MGTMESPAPSVPATPGTPAGPAIKTVYAVGIGVAGGITGALIGGGTGTVTVPSLDRFSRLRRAVIHGTATMPNIAVAVVGATTYWIHGGALDLTMGVPLMIGGVTGATFGPRLVLRVPERALRVAFVVVLAVAGTKLLANALDVGTLGGSALIPPAARGSLSVLALGVAIGVVIGAWSAALGLGGGMLVVPALVLLFGAGLHVAEGTSLMVMLPNSVAAARAHIRQGTASVPTGVRLAAGAVAGAVLGVFVALSLPGRSLGLFFGAFVLAMAVRELVRLRRLGARGATIGR